VAEAIAGVGVSMVIVTVDCPEQAIRVDNKQRIVKAVFARIISSPQYAYTDSTPARPSLFQKTQPQMRLGGFHSESRNHMKVACKENYASPIPFARAVLTAR
jgi:hypothetical protein